MKKEKYEVGWQEYDCDYCKHSNLNIRNRYVCEKCGKESKLAKRKIEQWNFRNWVVVLKQERDYADDYINSLDICDDEVIDKISVIESQLKGQLDIVARLKKIARRLK